MPVLHVDDAPVGRDALDVHVEHRQEDADARRRHPRQVELGWGHDVRHERDRAVGGRQHHPGPRGRHAVRVAEEGGGGGGGQGPDQGAVAGQEPREHGGRGDPADDRTAAGVHRRHRRADQRGDVRERGRPDPGVGRRRRVGGGRQVARRRRSLTRRRAGASVAPRSHREAPRLAASASRTRLGFSRLGFSPRSPRLAASTPRTRSGFGRPGRAADAATHATPTCPAAGPWAAAHRYADVPGAMARSTTGARGRLRGSGPENAKGRGRHPPRQRPRPGTARPLPSDGR